MGEDGRLAAGKRYRVAAQDRFGGRENNLGWRREGSEPSEASEGGGR